MFRTGKVRLTPDIEKAFFKISVSPKGGNYLRFLWWKDIDKDEMKPIDIAW